MRRTVQDGRAYCLVMQQDGPGQVEAHPDLYHAIQMLQENQKSGDLTVHFRNGDIIEIDIHTTVRTILQLRVGNGHRR